MTNYINCERCVDWSIGKRRSKLCDRCNNSQKTIDPKEIKCNLCGGYMCPLGTMSENYPNGLYNATVSGGYDSYYLFDLTSYTFSFCEKCLRTLFTQCKIPPLVADPFPRSIDEFSTAEYNFAEDQKLFEFRDWESNGGLHQAYLNGMCNMIKDCPNKAIYTQLNNGKFTEKAACEEHREMNQYVEASLTKFISEKCKSLL